MNTILSKQLKTIIFFVLLAAAPGLPGPSLAAESDDTDALTFHGLADAFYFDLRVLSYGIAQQPADSSQNPDNNFLRIPHYTADGDVRPDLYLKTDPLDLSVKPRLHIEYRDWEEGLRQGTQDWDHDFYVNEWLVRWNSRDDLFLSYGRENLQWGPSFLFSPSNPFFVNNGRRNPKIEVPGMDFGRVVWIPNMAWTVSFIANTDDGRNDLNVPGPFEKAYALKADYQGQMGYGSMILTHRENSENSLGLFGGRTMSDAVLAYVEGAIVQHAYALYPAQDDSPFGASMQRIYKDDSTIQPAVLVGSAYTFAGGGTLTGEYAYYGPGYSDAEAERYYTLRQSAADALSASGLISGLGIQTLAQTPSTGLRFLRRNYALLQYSRTNIQNRIDVTLRWTQNLDDWSSQWTGLASCMLGDHFQLFTVATVNAGGIDTEFKSLLDYQWLIGLEYTL